MTIILFFLSAVCLDRMDKTHIRGVARAYAFAMGLFGFMGILAAHSPTPVSVAVALAVVIFFVRFFMSAWYNRRIKI